jgi:superfamily II DNA helicase RecQ
MANIQVKYFMIPACGDDAAEEAVNRFLRGHQVLDVRQEFDTSPGSSVWCIAVRYAQNGRDGNGTAAGIPYRGAIDYKDELEPEVFVRFVELRKRRKAISTAVGMPAYAVFTDKELAGIAALENPQLADLKRIKGIGIKKVERFGAQILTPVPAQETENEATGPTA